MQTSFYVDMDMQRLIKEEVEWRCRLWAQGGEAALELPYCPCSAHNFSCVTSLPHCAAYVGRRLSTHAAAAASMPAVYEQWQGAIM